MNHELLSQCAEPATRFLDAVYEIVNTHMGNLVSRKEPPEVRRTKEKKTQLMHHKQGEHCDREV
jgi:hypothetical protein